MAKTRDRREARRIVTEKSTHTLDEIEKAFPESGMQKGFFKMYDGSGKKIDVAEMRKINPNYTFESRYTLEQISAFLY